MHTPAIIPVASIVEYTLRSHRGLLDWMFPLRSQSWMLVVRKAQMGGGQRELPPITPWNPENSRGTRSTELHDIEF